MSVIEARVRLDAEEAILLDSNPPAAEGGPRDAIAGAWPASPGQLGQLVRRLPRGCLLIAYCSCPDEHTSVRVASLLREHGYEAFALAGGLAAWQDAGFPLEPRAVEQARALDVPCPACGRPSHDHAPAAVPAVAPI
jgi:rhodanese-related sulfurtransferase